MLRPTLPLKEETKAGRYDAVEITVTDLMQRIRERISELESVPRDTVQYKECVQGIMDLEDDLRRAVDDARRTSILEKEQKRFKALNEHYLATKKLVEKYCDRTSPSVAFTMFTLDNDDEPVASNHEAYDIHRDKEFQQFFEEVHSRDVQIDEALDRIHFGVKRVGENAQGIKYELDKQEELLDTTEKKVDQNEEQIKGINKKIRKAIKKLGKSKLIVYAVMCIITIILIIVIIILAKSL